MSDTTINPNTIKLTLYISTSYSEYLEQFTYHVNTYDSTKYNPEHIPLETREIEVALPSPGSLIPVVIQGLKETQKQIAEESHTKIAQVQEKIDQLLTIGYNPQQSPPETTG
jgi:hypothetical protein